MKTKAKTSGFTLVEVSMVLVIIGLIIGVVMIGRELIFITQIRKQVKQLEEYETAVHAFVGKYNCLPGDCRSAESLGLGVAAGPGTNGDGNGRLSGGALTPGGSIADPSHTLVEPELINFWYHMSQSKLIPGSYPGYTGVDHYVPGVDTPPLVLAGQGFNTDAAQGYNPAGGVMAIPLDASNMTNDLASSAGQHWQLQGGKHAWYLGGGSNFTGAAGIYPGAIAYALDSKIDDGLPDSGKMVGIVFSLQAYIGFPSGLVYHYLRNPIATNEPENSCIYARDPAPAIPHYRADKYKRGTFTESLCSFVITTSF